MATVKFGYASSKNISFRGVIDSGYEKDEWDEMNPAARQEVYDETRNDLVQLWEIESE